MVDVAAGATKMPAATTINLATLIATSMLGEAGGLGPFPNQAAIEKNASNQQATSLAGRFFPGLLTQPGSQPVQAITMATAQAARNASRPSLPLPAQAPVVIGGPADVTATAPAGGKAAQAVRVAQAAQVAQEVVARVDRHRHRDQCDRRHAPFLVHLLLRHAPRRAPYCATIKWRRLLSSLRLRRTGHDEQANNGCRLSVGWKYGFMGL